MKPEPKTHYGNGYNTRCKGLVFGAKTSVMREKITCERCIEHMDSRGRMKDRKSYDPHIVHYGKDKRPICKTPANFPELSIVANEVNCAKCNTRLRKLLGS